MRIRFLLIATPVLVLVADEANLHVSFRGGRRTDPGEQRLELGRR